LQTSRYFLAFIGFFSLTHFDRYFLAFKPSFRPKKFY
jgi:hypothetical protein